MRVHVGAATVVLSVAAAAVVATVVTSCALEKRSGAGGADGRGDDAVGRHSTAVVAAPVPHVDNAYVLASKVELPKVKPLDAHGIHNLFKLSDSIYSGSEPEGEAAYAELARMGVKTVLSVDGKAPDVVSAVKHGLRYVHVPIEYRGLSDEELLQIAKSFRELPGPFYTHCFHGKHRGPAAAAVGRLVLDGASREQAIAEMRQWCGTAPEYEGLYRDIAMKPIPTEEATRGFAFDFPAQRTLEGLRSAMIFVSRRQDGLKKLASRDFAADPSHPDLVAAAEAAELATAFASITASPDIAAYGDDFMVWLNASTEQSRQLAERLDALAKGDRTALPASKQLFAAVNKACVECHAAYRDR